MKEQHNRFSICTYLQHFASCTKLEAECMLNTYEGIHIFFIVYLKTT